MDLGGSLWRIIKGTGIWLYRWLRVFIYWLGRFSGRSSIRFRLWFLRGKQKKSLAKLGERVYQLHQEGQTEWSEDAMVKEVLETVDTGGEKGEKLQGLSQELDEQYRENVQRLRAKPSSDSEEVETQDREETEDPGR
jgi:hypothetical protein